MPISRLAAAYPSKAPPEPFALLCGRLVDAKRYHLAIEAAAERQIPVTVIGDGPAEASLRKLADTLGVEATFLGRLPRPEALAVMDRATVLLHPSQDEAAPTVVLEARALGTPVVCCDAGDLKLWARRDDGIFLCHPEPSALAAGIDGARQASDKKRTTDHPSPVG